MITGLRVEMDGSHKVARCAIRGGSATDADPSTSSCVAAFELHLAPAEGDPDDVEYIPTDLSACVSRLPEYLQDSIICAPAPQPPRACRAPLPYVGPDAPLLTPPRPDRRTVERSQAPAFLQKLLSGVAEPDEE